MPKKRKRDRKGGRPIEAIVDRNKMGLDLYCNKEGDADDDTNRVGTMPARLRRLIRRNQALELRLEGHSYDKIAEVLNIDPAMARKLVERATRRQVKWYREASEEILQQELLRLDLMFKALYKQVEAGNCRAVEMALKVMERRSKYLGLDAPIKKEITLEHSYDKYSITELQAEAQKMGLSISVDGDLHVYAPALPKPTYANAPPKVIEYFERKAAQVLDALVEEHERNAHTKESPEEG